MTIRTVIQQSVLMSLFSLVLVPVSVFAATISLNMDSTTIHVGDTIIATVLVDTQGKSINLVEGTIDLNSASQVSQVTDLSVADSALTLWLRKPSLSPDGKSITFTGGTPNGFTSSNATLFKIIFVAKKAGLLAVYPRLINVYLNDGKGTLIPVQSNDLSITITPAAVGATPTNEWHNELVSDKTPPEPFVVVSGKDASLYNGETFLSFNTTDSGSGVDHYQVVEGMLPPVRTGDTYVLQHQNTPEVITVTAYDKAGNARTASYNTSPVSSSSRDVAIILTVLLFVYALYQTFIRIMGRRIKE